MAISFSAACFARDCRSPHGLRNDATYWARMPASFITLPIVAMSDFMLAASCPGELATTSDPALINRSFTSGLFRIRTISWLSAYP